jgi:CDP-glucose 4,6-dehydratase
VICRVAGITHLEPVVMNDASNEIPHQYLSAEKARRQLAWKPAYTLEQGMAETVAWYQQYFKENRT